jgi:hypothetical protein
MVISWELCIAAGTNKRPMAVSTTIKIYYLPVDLGRGPT